MLPGFSKPCRWLRFWQKFLGGGVYIGGLQSLQKTTSKEVLTAFRRKKEEEVSGMCLKHLLIAKRTGRLGGGDAKDYATLMQAMISSLSQGIPSMFLSIRVREQLVLQKLGSV